MVNAVTSYGNAKKRDQIHAAARELFLQHGFAGTTMDAITAAAQVSKHTLYRYYASKEALFADILDAMTLQRGLTVVWPEPETTGVTSRAELEAALDRIARDVIADSLQLPFLALMRILIAESPRFPYLKELFRTTVSGPGFASVTRLFAQAQANGVMVVPDTAAAVRLFIGALLTYFLIDGFFGPESPPHPSDEAITAIVRLVMRAVT